MGMVILQMMVNKIDKTKKYYNLLTILKRRMARLNRDILIIIRVWYNRRKDEYECIKKEKMNEYINLTAKNIDEEHIVV